MPVNTDRLRVTPSVLDRLLGAGMGSDGEYTLSRLREDIRRDVEWLLNARMPFLGLSNYQWTELKSSILVYGRPDLGMQKTEIEMRRYCQQVEEEIKYFEPRLHAVNVELVELPNSTDRNLHLRIRSTLKVEPNFMVDFDSDMNVATGQCNLRTR